MELFFKLTSTDSQTLVSLLPVTVDRAFLADVRSLPEKKNKHHDFYAFFLTNYFLTFFRSIIYSQNITSVSIKIILSESLFINEPLTFRALSYI